MLFFCHKRMDLDISMLTVMNSHNNLKRINFSVYFYVSLKPNSAFHILQFHIF